NRIDVVPLQAVATPATILRAGDAVEVGRGAEVERGAKLSPDVAAEMDHGVDVDAVVGGRFEERVSGHLLGQPYRDRSAAHDVAGLAVMGVAAPIRAQVTDDDAVGAL